MEHHHMHGTYDTMLVILSLIIAVAASYTTLDLAGRVAMTSGKNRTRWLILGAASMGMGIWSMHFVGMLAFSLPVPVSYDLFIVILSVIIAIAASFVALYVVGRKQLKLQQLLVGSSLLATGISAMHYVGMEAMLIDITYEPIMFSISILIAIVASIAALWLAFYFRKENEKYAVSKKLASGVIMGAAIVGMHYTGMEAAQFHMVDEKVTVAGMSLDQRLLGYVITAGTMLTLGLSLIGIFVDKRLSRKDSHIKKNEKWYRSLYENNRDGILSVSLSGRIIGFNPAAITITGIDGDYFHNRSIIDIAPIIVEEERKRTKRLFLRSFRGKTISYETAITHQNGSLVHLSVINVPVHVEGKIVGHYVIAKDITREKKAEQKIRHMAFHDELTGLPNRRKFDQVVVQAIEKYKSSEHTFSVMVMDIDRFKMINDSLGHAYGDRLLQMVTNRLHEAISGYEATIARMGGDEFTVVCFGSKAEIEPISSEIASRMLKEAQLPYHLKDNDFYISASIGIAIYPEHGTESAELMKNADTAMYEVKKNGKNGYQYYSDHLDAHLLERIELEADLRKAIQRNELIIYYQPQIHAHNSSLIGIEALLRWNHPIRGIISPSIFIPIAEESGLIVEISEWVMRQACLQMRKWQQEWELYIPVSVNLSTQQFHQNNLAQKVEQILLEVGLEAKYLELEITESMMMDICRSTSTLQELKELGVRISMDDFGTGYSSLNYLKMFPIGKLKIDQSFIRDLTNSESDKAIVATIISMAHHLKMNVIAEGVETAEQLAFLKESGCDDIQGYYFSRPLPAKELQRVFLGKCKQDGKVGAAKY
ncbi:EAL domain-containing protein [Paenibacillus agilis]|uniref:EAL domain-containing protein n=1 Tax=Paenibacillus agilis TaxID=3020863 RepID=A0A559J3H2_9BACL|nr:EAL domain-containing protein [Paenibacillus agilis]TVX94366.1 EAL domain-containing protein [Paenibacillus agilis]